jgi:tetratricopeptide (TPR) repeat protein
MIERLLPLTGIYHPVRRLFMRNVTLALVLIPLFSACSMFAANRDTAYDGMPAAKSASAATGAPASTTSSTAAPESPLALADAAWAKRDDAKVLAEAIAHYEAALAEDPKAIGLYERLARANYFLADAHLRDSQEKQEVVFNKAIEWGERCMGLDGGFKAKLDAGTKAEDAFEVLPKEYTGCLYWTAAALGKWATIKGFSTRVANKGRITKLVERVTILDPTYFYGAPDRYWGAYFAILPGFMGKDLNKSEAHFKKSLELAPNYLGTKVLMAERLATERQDRAMFKRLLDEAIAADPNVDPSIAPENKVEQQKARALLTQIDDKVPE